MASPGARRLLEWLDARTGLGAFVRAACDEPVPGGARWAYVFGSVLTFLFVLQAATGAAMALYYSASASDAWASVAYLQRVATAGWFVRGLHGYGASAMVIVLGLHLAQVIVWGAYKAPREVNWLFGLALAALVMTFALTGYLLPWDQKGYWATQVATSIVGTTPLVGRALQRLVQGGEAYGNLTLTRFYALHTVVLPGALVALIVGHVALFRRHGVTPGWRASDAELAARRVSFWPDQLLRDVLAMAVCLTWLVLQTVRTHGVELGAPADPASTYVARPEWYFLALFQLLKYFDGPLEVVGTLGIPAAAGALLVALPWLDRGPSRAPRARKRFVALLLAGGAALAALTVQARLDDARDPALRRQRAEQEREAARALELAVHGVPPAGGVAVYENDPLFAGRRVWKERCQGCHEGDERRGPDLSGYNSRAWIEAFLRAPGHDRFFGRTKVKGMKPVRGPDEALRALTEWVFSQQGSEAGPVDAALAARGRAEIEARRCDECHDLEGAGDGSGPPVLGGRGTRAWLRELIADPAGARFFGEKNDMPAMKTKLSAEQIAAVADLVWSFRQVAR